ncbi:UPF0175 family protein [Nodosilinea nodulosa]|uniref:UPF0175 family protein n=1 Tax=Nodosilinea nodulosa TaxID=416001 RepID=UPI0002DDFB2B|nr:UPF0175 family protein [Nodosilinea nodulosa]
MQTIHIELPDTIFSSLRKAPQEFVQEMRIAAAVKWYELGKISQEKAAEIAGLHRADFINTLTRYRVSVLQYTATELTEELADAD